MASITERLTRAFISCELPCAEWTHEAHLRVGLWHVRRFDPPHATALLRERIRAYNERCGRPNSDRSGYHETLTRFYVELIAAFVTEREEGEAEEGVATALIATVGDRDLPLRYYSAERLWSSEARREWLEPDLQPLPRASER